MSRTALLDTWIRIRASVASSSDADAQPARLQGARWQVYRQIAIRRVGIADHELVRKLDWLGVSPQRIRTARSELVRSALVEPVPGIYRLTPNGKRAQVWRAR